MTERRESSVPVHNILCGESRGGVSTLFAAPQTFGRVDALPLIFLVSCLLSCCRKALDKRFGSTLQHSRRDNRACDASLTAEFWWAPTALHGESFIFILLCPSIRDVLLVICVRLPSPSHQRGTTPMCPGGNGMRQSTIVLIFPHFLPEQLIL